MKFVEVNTYEEMSLQAAEIIAQLVKSKPDCVLGLATGSTPVGTYAQLIQRCQNGELDFSKVKTVNLDEYAGLEGSHEQSYRYFMNKNLFDGLNIDIANTYVPNGCAEDIAAECAAYDARIADFGGIDLQVLGIGMDGHIGFNEPDDVFIKETHAVDLHPSTIEANSRFFESADEVPRRAVTMGMLSIMQAKKIVMVINGAAKREILEKAFFGPITPQVPASILQLHADVTVIYSKE